MKHLSSTIWLTLYPDWRERRETIGESYETGVGRERMIESSHEVLWGYKISIRGVRIDETRFEKLVEEYYQLKNLDEKYGCISYFPDRFLVPVRDGRELGSLCVERKDIPDIVIDKAKPGAYLKVLVQCQTGFSTRFYWEGAPWGGLIPHRNFHKYKFDKLILMDKQGKNDLREEDDEAVIEFFEKIFDAIK